MPTIYYKNTPSSEALKSILDCITKVANSYVAERPGFRNMAKYGTAKYGDSIPIP